MKKIYLYAMALGLMFASCEDFLTEYPRCLISEDPPIYISVVPPVSYDFTDSFSLSIGFEIFFVMILFTHKSIISNITTVVMM